MPSQESALLLRPGFSVADAGYPSFSLEGGTLVLRFVDWQERPVLVEFVGAAAVTWQEVFPSGPQPREDEVFEIIGSSWVRSHVSQGARDDSEHLRHFRLCFNACGCLDVLATSMLLGPEPHRP